MKISYYNLVQLSNISGLTDVRKIAEWYETHKGKIETDSRGNITGMRG